MATMSNNKNVKKVKSSIPGHPPSKKKTQTKAIADVPDMCTQPKPWPIRKVRMMTPTASEAFQPSNVPDDILMATTALLDLAGGEKSQQNPTESASEQSEIEIISEKAQKAVNMEVDVSDNAVSGMGNEDESSSDSSDEEDEGKLLQYCKSSLTHLFRNP